MPSSRIPSRFESLRNIAEQFRQKAIEKSPELIEELKTLARQPRALGAWLETKSPWLNRQFLGAASNIAEPFTAGMGLKIERLGEDLIEVTLPGGWRNQGENGLIHAGAIAVLGEFTARIFWEYHLDLRSSEIEIQRIQVRRLGRAAGDLKGVYRLPVAERESVLLKIRSEGSAKIETLSMIYDSSGLLVAEVEAEWELRRQLALGSGHNTGRDSGHDSGATE